MTRSDLIKRILGVTGADPTPENVSDVTTLIDEYDRSGAKEASLAAKTSAYLYRDAAPYSEELEAKFLGAVLTSPIAAMVKVRNIFREGLFFLPAHEWVGKAIIDLHDKSQKISTQSVIEELRNTDYEGTDVLERIGGAYFVEDLLFGVTSWEEAEEHGDALLQYWIKRQCIHYASVFIREMSKAKLSDVNEVRAKFMTDMQDLAKSLDLAYGVADADSLADLLIDNVMSMYEKRKLAKPGEMVLVGVPSGINDLDMLTGGWKGDQLIIIQARPGMGKTGYIISEIIVALENGESIIVFSLEMSKLSLVKRIMTMMEYMDPDELRRGDIKDEHLAGAQSFIEWLRGKGIYITDKPHQRISLIREISLNYRANFGISRIYVDYLQLAKGDTGGNREQEVASIARGLKNISKETGVPVIALSQLGRGVEMRGGTKRPQISDARESGEIEQAADLVVSLYRPEYYQIMEDEEGQSLKGIGEILVQKHREGGLKDIRARFEKTSRWVDIDADKAPVTFQPSIEDSIKNIPPSRLNDDEDIPW